MEVEVKKYVVREVEETFKMNLLAFWTIRVLHYVSDNTAYVDYCEEFAYEPTEQEIADVLAKHSKHSYSFASVIKNYRLVEVAE